MTDDTSTRSAVADTAVTRDAKLSRWSTVLMITAAFAAVITVAEPIYSIIWGGVVGLSRNNGQQIWTTTLSTLPVPEWLTIVVVGALTNVAWLYGLLQIWRLARYYRDGHIFEERHAVCFIRLGLALVLIGILASATYPFLNLFLYWRGISPWLGDMPPLFILQPDYLVAGLFFFVLGKIMRRAIELEETNRLII